MVVLQPDSLNITRHSQLFLRFRGAESRWNGSPPQSFGWSAASFDHKFSFSGTRGRSIRCNIAACLSRKSFDAMQLQPTRHSTVTVICYSFMRIKP